MSVEDNNNPNGEDLTEEQSNWYHSKNPAYPTPVSSDETEPLYEAVEVECRNCSIKKLEEYDTPITKLQYLEYCINKICPQCKKPYQLNPIKVGFESEQQKATRNLYTLEQWRTLLYQRYNELKQTVADNIPQLWPAIELVLSVKAILNIKGCTLPMIMILLGAPSSLKTVAIQLLRPSPTAFYTDNFTPKSFVSHSTAVKEEQLRKIDLLPRIKNKIFLAPELAPLFAKKDDELVDVIGILTRVADGQGFESDSGGCGHRGYPGEHMFVMIGAAVDIPYKVHKHLGNIGPKIHFFRLGRVVKTEDEYLKELQQDTFGTRYKKIEQALNLYLNVFDMGPFVIVKDVTISTNTCEQDNNSKQEEVFLKKMEWNAPADEVKALKILIKMGILLAHLRAVVNTWDPRNSSVTDHGYRTAKIEQPDRAIEQLRNLARGHALSQGRNHISQEDLSIPIKVVLSTASIDRVNIFDLLIANQGLLKTSRITKSLNMSAPTARDTMWQLKAVGLVDFIEKDNENEEMEIELFDKFNWFLSDEFAKLREEFVPTDYREYLKQKKEDENGEDLLKEKSPPYTREPESKPEGGAATYICKNCDKEQFTDCWELHKKSCTGRNKEGLN